jgi:hypothetical protein
MWGCLRNLLAVEKHVLGRAWGAPGVGAICASRFLQGIRRYFAGKNQAAGI